MLNVKILNINYPQPLKANMISKEKYISYNFHFNRKLLYHFQLITYVIKNICLISWKLYNERTFQMKVHMSCGVVHM